MTDEVKIAPMNSLLLIMDRETGEIPDSLGGKLVASTPSCIAVGTLSEGDGQTSVVLTDEKRCAEDIINLKKVYTGFLATPSREVNVCTVLLQPVMKLAVSSDKSKIEIWANSEAEPSKLYVLVIED